MKPTALLAVFALSIAPVFGQAGPPQPSKTPKETIASLKLDKILSDEKALTAEAQLAQDNFKAMMGKFQSDYGEDQRQAESLIEEVRKENGWGPQYTVDRNPQSATFGKWVEEPTAPPVKAPTKKQ